MFSPVVDGRQPVYLASLPLVCMGSLYAALSRNVIQLVIGRTIQAFGASRCVLPWLFFVIVLTSEI